MKRWWLYPIALLTLLSAACLLVVRFDQPAFLSFSKKFLNDGDSPAKADVLFLLGGDFSRRAPFAAQLYRRGFAPKILLAHEPSAGHNPNFTDTTASILEANGVPKDRIIDFSPAGGVTSTADEARALKLYLAVYPAKSLLVVTSAYHTRRARLAMTRALRGTGTRILVAGVGESEEESKDWLNSEPGRSRLELEWLKLFYYFFTFWG